MTTLTRASNQWASRPDDQRFTSLTEMLAAVRGSKERSVAKVINTRKIEVCPVEGDDKGLCIVGPNGAPVLPTHWSFGQIAQRADAPASYMRKLHPALAADCLNYGLRRQDIQEIQVLLRKDDENAPATLAAATGPNYGRIWNDKIIEALMQRFGDGVTGAFRVPGEFGQQVEVNKNNTTLFASDRDMFVFLADEEHRIEVPNRRNGLPGSLARGFFVWNSEVGSQTFGIATFLFDYVCSNRIVWGADKYSEIRVRHTSAAPERFIEEITPALLEYSNSATVTVTDAIANARRRRLDDVDSFLKDRKFNASQVKAINLAHVEDEGRPIETLWDAVTGITAYAREIKHQDARVDLERAAGKLMNLAG